MAKTKYAASAKQRREQEHTRQGLDEQRHQRTRNQSRGKRLKQHSSRNAWLFVTSIVMVVVAIIVAISIIGNHEQTTKISVSPSVYKSLTNINPTQFSQVGTGNLDSSISTLIKPVKSTPVLNGPTGKPEVFYMGAEYCPFCAAQRWAMIIALNRFGSFTTLPTPIVSGEDSISTYSFYKSVYQSKYIDFVPVEVDNNSWPTQEPLQNLTADQNKIVTTYDAPPYSSNTGSFPFISVGNQYVSAGAYYDPSVIMGHSYDDIIQQLQDPTTDISRNMLGAANYLTAQICSLTNNQPSSVCATGPIPTIQGQLPQASTLISHDTNTLVNIDIPQEVAVQKQPTA